MFLLAEPLQGLQTIRTTLVPGKDSHRVPWDSAFSQTLLRPWKEGHLELRRKQTAMVQGTGVLNWNKNSFSLTA